MKIWFKKSNARNLKLRSPGRTSSFLTSWRLTRNLKSSLANKLLEDNDYATGIDLNIFFLPE